MHDFHKNEHAAGKAYMFSNNILLSLQPFYYLHRTVHKMF